MVEAAPSPGSFLVLVTGHAAVGKSTIAPLLARELDAVWISRDAIHERIYSGWEPRHPALFSEQYDPVIGGSTFAEGKVNWSIFLWVLQQVVSHAPVVADTPFNHAWGREMFAAAAANIAAPMLEVVLTGDPDVLLARARERAERAMRGDGHEIKARFAGQNPRSYYEHPYEPVLDAARAITVDATDLGSVNVAEMAAMVRGQLATG